MYEIVYNNSFLLNFITSFIFLLLLIIFSFSNYTINNKSITLFGKFQPLAIFFITLSLIVFLFNIIIYLNIYKYLNFIFYLFILSLFIIWFFLADKKKIKIFHKNIFNKKSIIVICFFVIFFLVSILPISDADSIAIHQNLANYIYFYGLEAINLSKNFEFTTLSNSEILLIISPILKSDNFGSQLNFFSLLVFFIVSFKYNKSFIFFIFSCPLIIFLVSTQKLQLFFGILYLLLFILVHQNLIKKKIEIFLFIILLSFYASAKISYILIALPLFFYYLILNKKSLNLILIYSFTVFIFFFTPIFLIKYKFLGNPISPFFDNFFNDNNQLINSFALNLRSSEGWLGRALEVKIFLKPFMPLSLSPSNLSNNLGLLFLFQLFNYSLLKKTKFIPIIIIALIISTGQLLPRYYFEAFLLLSFFYKNDKNNLVNVIKFLQSSIILILSVLFLFNSYFKTNVIFEKNKFMNRFSYSFYNAQQYNKLNISENILSIPQDRQSMFLKNNIYGSRGVYVRSLYTDKSSVLISFVKENSIKYIVGANNITLPSCIVLNKIGDINQKKTVRNFLLHGKEISYNIYLIDIESCKL